MDKAIRIWAIASKTKDMTQSQQELPALRHAVPSFVVNDAHSSPIYCMLYDKDGSRLLSGDAQGVVRIWSCSFQEMKPTLIALAVLESENEYVRDFQQTLAKLYIAFPCFCNADAF